MLTYREAFRIYQKKMDKRNEAIMLHKIGNPSFSIYSWSQSGDVQCMTTVEHCGRWDLPIGNHWGLIIPGFQDPSDGWVAGVSAGVSGSIPDHVKPTTLKFVSVSRLALRIGVVQNPWGNPDWEKPDCDRQLSLEYEAQFALSSAVLLLLRLDYFKLNLCLSWFPSSPNRVRSTWSFCMLIMTLRIIAGIQLKRERSLISTNEAKECLENAMDIYTTEIGPVHSDISSLRE